MSHESAIRNDEFVGGHVCGRNRSNSDADISCYFFLLLGVVWLYFVFFCFHFLGLVSREVNSKNMFEKKIAKQKFARFEG